MRLKLVAAAFVAIATLTPMAIQAPRAQSTSVARVIVKYKPDAGLMHTQAMTIAGARATQMRTLSQRIGTPLVAGSDISESSHVVFARGLSSAELAAKLSADSDVEYAEPDRIKHRLSVPNDPLYSSVQITGSTGGPTTGQWYLKPPGPTTLAGTSTLSGTAPSAINAEQAWNITTGNANIVVAVLDTGLRFDHPDFKLASVGGNVLPGYDMIAADDANRSTQDPDGLNTVGGSNFSTANDHNGRDADASDPGDGITQAQIDADNTDFGDCKPEDSSWHGTQTLSLIGARTDNNIGMASVARNVSVMPVRVLGRCGSGYDSDILAGMLWAGGVSTPTGVPANAHPARVINLSLGSDDPCSVAEQDVVNQLTNAGVVVVVSAGNSGIAVGSPANCTGAIGVTGLRSDGDKLGVSSYGSKATIAAPGGNCPTNGACTYPILAAFNAGTTDPVAGGNYTGAFGAVFTGTSFSAPLVAGAAALMLSVNPALTPAQVKAKLMSSARPFPTSGSSIGTVPMCTEPGSSTTAVTNCYCTTATCGAGMLDVHAAVMSVAAATTVSVGVTSTTPTAGLPVTLTAATTFGTGATSATYTWAITDAGTTGAAITSGQGSATVVITPTAAGTFTVSLTTVDSAGNSVVTNSAVVVAAAAGSTGGGGTTTTPSSGGGGGGAIGFGWLALLLAAIGALAVVNRADRIERRAISVPVRSPRRR